MDQEAASRLRVFLADDHPVVLSGMKALVAGDAGLEMVGEASDGPSALRRAVELRPDVAVLDLSMPGLNGIEVARKFLAACPECRVLVLTVHEDGAYLKQLLDLGVAGYVLKRSATEELIRGIHAVGAGGLYLDPAIAGRAIGRAAPHLHSSDHSNAVAELSTREIEVLRLAAVGHSNKTIAAKLQIGSKSVETYKARGMAKLGFHNRVEVVRFALSMGWLSDP
ncbi:MULTISPECIES: response regulator transcription factor [Rhodopseudomonas]|uniref:LuxR family transcriptional regulator n=1 Tax=Rhodopseudomonas palustris TaxID=1076 RepID=A0A0D7EGM4_RHOPL|nr:MULTISPECIES: response regulator transcription factor [Rhodopseudomonas]KIZ39806.1 LuxR family transcriptional regulator [Rhodopseudomonas palustris]MDF3809911.1 response regulator transcription factor [Rhodopseudomonas sp. BAL398]WOK17831.1 response regulator transcription factor [Rhodopseudomonas sp. BAL398]